MALGAPAKPQSWLQTSRCSSAIKRRVLVVRRLPGQRRHAGDGAGMWMLTMSVAAL